MKIKNNKTGFSLFELLVVISIIGIIVAVGAVSYSSAQKKARDVRRREDIQAVSKALEQYYSVSNVYIVGCNPGSDYLLGGLPNDPKNTGVYIYSWLCGTDSYCVCANLENDTGNANGVGTATDCSFASGGYYCIQSQQ